MLLTSWLVLAPSHFPSFVCFFPFFIPFLSAVFLPPSFTVYFYSLLFVCPPPAPATIHHFTCHILPILLLSIHPIPSSQVDRLL